MISCLNNYIGLIGVQDESLSGRYVNDLSGITTQRVKESYEEDDTYEPLSAWYSIERAAINKFEKRVLSWAKRFMMNYSNLGTTISGQYRDKTLVGTTNEWKGVFFNYDFKINKALMIKAQWANLYSEGDVLGTTIRAYNAATGDLIETKTVDLVSGDNRIYLGWEFPIWRYPKVFIVYDANAVTTIKQDSYDFSTRTNLEFKKISKASAILSDNLANSGSDNGLLLTYSISCSLDNFICNRVEIFEEPYLYCLASEILRQSIHSESINRYTLLDYEEAEKLRNEYEEEYEEMIEEILRSLTMESDGICFKCNRLVNHRPMLP